VNDAGENTGLSGLAQPVERGQNLSQFFQFPFLFCRALEKWRCDKDSQCLM
jgi:hypothetical protein